MFSLMSVWIGLLSLLNSASPYGLEKDSCREINCKNGSPCRTTFVKKDGKFEGRAECICHDNWIGPQCEHEISMKLLQVSHDRIKVTIVVNIDNTTLTKIRDDVDMGFAVQYWTNDTSDGCSLLRNLGSTVEIKGLKPRTHYFICAKNNYVDWCYPTIHKNTGFSSNCLVILTHDVTRDVATSLVLPISISVFIFLVILFLCLLCFNKNRFLVMIDYCRLTWCPMNCCKATIKRPHRTARRKQNSNEQHPFLTGMETPPPERHVKLNPSSPGKPKHQLATQPSGYTSYIAKNSQSVALKSVIEYAPEENSEKPDSNLVVQIEKEPV